MATSPRSAPMFPSKGVQYDINPVDPRAEVATQTGMCDVVAYCDNGGIRQGDGGYVTHDIWGSAGIPD